METNLYAYSPPKYNHGNNCGHSCLFPSIFERDEGKKKTYSVIHKALDKLKDYYFDQYNHLERLRYNRSNGQRSESREIVASVLSYLIDKLDINSMTSVKYKNGKQYPISILDIAIDLKAGYTRVYRALKVLQEAKYITLEHQSYFKDNVLIKRVAIKRISECLFTDLQISRLQIHKEKSFSSKRPSPGFTEVFDKLTSNKTNFKKNMSSLCEITGNKKPKLNLSDEEIKHKRYLKDASAYNKLFDVFLKQPGVMDKAISGEITTNMIRAELAKKGHYHPDFNPPS